MNFTFFFFNDTATTEIYTLSLHDALPISVFSRPKEDRAVCARHVPREKSWDPTRAARAACAADRKSTRLNSSHTVISYAVFCLKKKKKPQRGVLTADGDGHPARRTARHRL